MMFFIPKLLLTLFCSLQCVAGKGIRPRNVRFDLSDVVNPDPKASNMDMGEYNEGNQFFEGDILKSPNQADGKYRGAATSKSELLWPQGKVYYTIDSTAGTSEKEKLIKDAINDFHQYTCVKFVPRKEEPDWIRFQSGMEGCFVEQLGRKHGGPEVVNLGEGCWTKGTVIHEMMHAIGFDHEQTRPDRDNYVRINFNNIFSRYKHAFKKYPSSEINTMNFPYDFSSVMHYNSYAFGMGRDSGKTIETLDPRNQDKIGQRAGFSKQDIQEVNTLYKCKGKESMVGGKIGCYDKNKGYCKNTVWEPNNCSERQKAYCKTTCGQCDDAVTSGGGGGGSSSCEDTNKEYCEVTLDLRNGPNYNCEYPNSASYCKKSCKKC